jgi:ferric-dicitrate binding protein FerR (iron transport regulator)
MHTTALTLTIAAWLAAPVAAVAAWAGAAAVARTEPVPAAPSRQAGAPESATRSGCRRWRRLLIGAAIGAAAAAPLAGLVNRRFENEAADGTAAAAGVVGLGGLGGALVGNATCRH